MKQSGERRHGGETLFYRNCNGIALTGYAPCQQSPFHLVCIETPHYPASIVSTTYTHSPVKTHI